jgi:hypothetical protein
MLGRPYPVITSLCGYWWQVGRHNMEPVRLWTIRITSSLTTTIIAPRTVPVKGAHDARRR